MSFKKKSRTIGFTVICLIIIFLNLKYILARKYAVDVSPDGNYKMIIYQFPAINAGFPGQGGAGGSPGYLVVRDTNTNLKIASEETYMLDAAYPIIWTPEKVTAGKFIAIELPDTYHETSENRQYFMKKQLIQAAKDGDIVLAKKLLKQGAVLDENAPCIDSPLCNAALKKHYKIVTFFLQQNDYLSRLNHVKNGILSHHAILSDPQVVTFLIQSGLDPNQGDDYNLSPLRVSIQIESFESFQTLIEYGAIINLEEPGIKYSFQRASPEFQKKVLALLKEKEGLIKIENP